MTEWCRTCSRRVDWLSYCLHCGTPVERQGEAGKQPVRRWKYVGKIRSILLVEPPIGMPYDPYEKSPR